MDCCAGKEEKEKWERTKTNLEYAQKVGIPTNKTATHFILNSNEEDLTKGVTFKGLTIGKDIKLDIDLEAVK